MKANIVAGILIVVLIMLQTTVCCAQEPGSESENVIKFTDYKKLSGKELIKMVQLVLRDSGFDPGPTDGIFGPKTREAIKSFQMQNRYEPTGEIDKQTLDKLFWSF